MRKYRTMRVLLVLFVMLSACNVAGPGFRGAPATRAEAGGSHFLLRYSDGMVEVTRTSRAFLPRFPVIASHAAEAILMQTGCESRWFVGDPAMMIAGLSCNGGRAPPKPRKRRSYVCDVTGGYLSGRRGVSELELECRRS
ncbi:hypothetical protein SAMN06295998_102124 [Primorskyibacter flagellatus]|uniref:Lipoprotein n=2 Tax=Primorskyibacter flagellatus TaxID=1387277 RepID=A0A1W1ZTE9_9RHOB|nr:hypothetical protein SAMN06295998_102124 [Primorskyibacter flagellatus]